MPLAAEVAEEVKGAVEARLLTPRRPTLALRSHPAVTLQQPQRPPWPQQPQRLRRVQQPQQQLWTLCLYSRSFNK